MLKIDTEVVLQSRQPKGTSFIPTRYLFARKRGDFVTLAIASRPISAPIRLVLTTDAVKRLEDTLRMIRSIGRDVEIGIWPRRSSGKGTRPRGRRKAS